MVADHGIRTHVPTTIVRVDQRDILQLVASFPDIGRALWFDTLVDASIFREWTVNIGRRNARERTAHLLLEFAHATRYHFDCVDSYREHDEEGTDLPDEEAARVMAVQFAGEVLKSDPETVWRSGQWRVEVADERGVLLFTLLTVSIDAPRPHLFS